MLQIDLTHDLILAALEDILYSGGAGNFFIIDLGADYYIQLAASRGAYEVYCEAISNAYLTEESRLNQAQIEQLTALGWKAPESSADNFQLIHNVDSEASRQALTQLIATTANTVYGFEKIEFQQINLNLE